jgi:hypothetical protein
MANVDGEWKTVIDSPGGDQSGVLTVKSSGNSFTGAYETEGNTNAIQNGKVDGNALSWKMNIVIPMPMSIECKATVTGDSLTGTAVAGAFGSWPLTGTRE